MGFGLSCRTFETTFRAWCPLMEDPPDTFLARPRLDIGCMYRVVDHPAQTSNDERAM